MLKLKDLKPTEAEITKDIRGYLDIRGIPHFKKLQGLGCPKGISDIIGCYKGRFLGIEVKILGRELTFEQDMFIRRFKNAGGICFVAYSVEDVERELKSIATHPGYETVTLNANTREKTNAFSREVESI